MPRVHVTTLVLASIRENCSIAVALCLLLDHHHNIATGRPFLSPSASPCSSSQAYLFLSPSASCPSTSSSPLTLTVRTQPASIPYPSIIGSLHTLLPLAFHSRLPHTPLHDIPPFTTAERKSYTMKLLIFLASSALTFAAPQKAPSFSGAALVPTGSRDPAYEQRSDELCVFLSNGYLGDARKGIYQENLCFPADNSIKCNSMLDCFYLPFSRQTATDMYAQFHACPTSYAAMSARFVSLSMRSARSTLKIIAVARSPSILTLRMVPISKARGSTRNIAVSTARSLTGPIQPSSSILPLRTCPSQKATQPSRARPSRLMEVSSRQSARKSSIPRWTCQA